MSFSASDTIRVRIARAQDAPQMLSAFVAAGKSRPKYVAQCYLAGMMAELRIVWLAYQHHAIAGYISLLWTSPHLPFQNRHIPSISDLYVLPPYRGKGVASRLLDAAESMACTRATAVGLGVGLYRDYGPAQQLYAKRGYIPDGSGITHRTCPATPGRSVVVDDELLLWLVKPLSHGK